MHTQRIDLFAAAVCCYGSIQHNDQNLSSFFFFFFAVIKWNIAYKLKMY